ncbi:hypothetical protein ROA7023_02859 [Roseisalinus antarcticus]|uniref:Uncharacterized protein n=1 Tax=Roseisalinus antarcticus TaxID=254357 RepID=A0A1Y5TDK5_9RHOB|nr:hypothetical protein ROA7023_02859 [Roseisalinus antarcticus]
MDTAPVVPLSARGSVALAFPVMDDRETKCVASQSIQDPKKWHDPESRLFSRRPGGIGLPTAEPVAIIGVVDGEVALHRAAHPSGVPEPELQRDLFDPGQRRHEQRRTGGGRIWGRVALIAGSSARCARKVDATATGRPGASCTSRCSGRPGGRSHVRRHLDQRQRRVHPGRQSGGGPDVAVTQEDRILAHVHLRVALFEDRAPPPGHQHQSVLARRPSSTPNTAPAPRAGNTAPGQDLELAAHIEDLGVGVGDHRDAAGRAPGPKCLIVCHGPTPDDHVPCRTGQGPLVVRRGR